MGRPRTTHGRQPARNIRVGEELWTTFGTAAGANRRSAVLTQFMAWYTGDPEAALPVRPQEHPEEDQSAVTDPEPSGDAPPPDAAPCPPVGEFLFPRSFGAIAPLSPELRKSFSDLALALRPPKADHDVENDPDEQVPALPRPGIARDQLILGVLAAVRLMPPNLASVTVLALLDLVSEIDTGTTDWTAHHRRVLAAAAELLDMDDADESEDQ